MKRLVLVDDENELRNAIAELIPWEKYGYSVVGSVENGKEALALLKQGPIDLMICDLIMPQMDGLELVQQAKLLQPDITILILSNYSEFDYVKQALQLGAADYLLKATFSEAALAPLLIRFNEDLPKQPLSYSAEMQAKLLVTSPTLPVDEQTRFFTRFQTDTPLLLIARAQKNPEKYKQALTDYLAKLFPDTLIISLVYQKMYLFFIDTSATNQAIRKLITTNFTCQKELFFIAQWLKVDDLLTEILKVKVQPKFELQFALRDKQIVFTEENIMLDTIPQFPKQTFQHYFLVADPIGGIKFLINHTHSLTPLVLSEATVKEYISYVLFALINELEQLNVTAHELALMKLEILQTIHASLDQQDMLHRFIEKLQQLQTIFYSRQQEAHLPFHEISDYLYRNTHRQVTLKELADHFHYNYSYLSSLFPQVTEMNFTNYMNELRIKRAKDLLKQVDVTISEVAESIGFTDISYFSKVFKKRTGQTPSQYRRGIEHV